MAGYRLLFVEAETALDSCPITTILGDVMNLEAF